MSGVVVGHIVHVEIDHDTIHQKHLNWKALEGVYRIRDSALKVETTLPFALDERPVHPISSRCPAELILIVLVVLIVGYICNPAISGFHFVGLSFLLITILTAAYAINTHPNAMGTSQYSGLKLLVVLKTTSTPGV